MDGDSLDERTFVRWVIAVYLNLVNGYREGALSSMNTREAILVAARDLFFESGLAGTSMRDIAQLTGLAQSSLYNHFASKDALVMAVMERSFDLVDGAIREMFEAEPSIGLLREVLRRHALQHIHGIKETTVFESEGRHMPDAVRRRVIELRGIYEDRFYTLAQRLADTERITRDETRTRMRMLLGAGVEISRWFQPGRRLDEQQIANVYADFGLASVEAKPS